MKKKLFNSVATLSLISALSLTAVACAHNAAGNESGKNNSSGTKQTETFATSNDFFAVSAVSGANFLIAEKSAADLQPRLFLMAEKEIPTERPFDFTDENVSKIKNVLVMFESAIGSNVSSEITANTDTDGEYSAYAYKMNVNYGSENAVMYYNETNVRTNTEEDDDEISTETSAELNGVLVVGDNTLETFGKRKEETEADEKEFKLELVVKKTDTDFIIFTYKTENESGENETKYECEIYENGKKVQETEFEIEEKDGKTEIKFELETGGKSDGVEYKIVRRDENRFDIRKEENNKKSYILAEKLTDGYKFTYSNGYSENLTAD